MLKIQKYPAKSQLLKKFINFYWVIKWHDFSIDHKILPFRNIDLLINLTSDINYVSKENKLYKLQEVYFAGMSDRYNFRMVKKSGEIEAIGISFNALGLYPFIGIPMVVFKHQLIDMDVIKKHFSNEVSDMVRNANTVEMQIQVIEEFLIELLDEKYIISNKTIGLFNSFYINMFTLSVEEFCSKHGMHVRTFERLFDKYVGISPKTYTRICRFQKTLNQSIRGDFNTMTDLAYSNGYYDQMHFIKEFKSFTGETPFNFINQKPSLKQISTFS